VTWDGFLSSFVTLLVTVDPLGLAPLFVSLSAGMTRAERLEIALSACAIAFGVLLLFALLGTAILDLFGITLPAFRIAGGLLLFVIAFEMIFERRQERHERSAGRTTAAERRRNLAVFPLAIPLLAGPGAISAVILISGQATGTAERAALIGIVAAVMALSYLTFRLADRIDRHVGETPRMVATRLLGIILSALAVQFVADGVTSFVRGPAG